MKIETFSVDPEGEKDAWLALRQRDVTASVVGSLFGINPYKTRFELWLEKDGRLTEDEVDEEADALVRGRLLEPIVLKLLAQQYPSWEIWQPDVYLRAPDLGLGATPDAYARDPKRKGRGVIQVKTTIQRNFVQEWVNAEGEVEPPLWIVLQTIQEAVLAQADWACVGVLSLDGRMKPTMIDVPIHRAIFDRSAEEARAFWDSIAAGDVPAPDYTKDSQVIARLHAEDNGREIDLTGDNMLPAILAEREELLQRMRFDKQRLTEIDAEIAHKVGDFERAIVGDWIVKRPMVTRKGFFVEPTTYRRTIIKSLSR